MRKIAHDGPTMVFQTRPTTTMLLLRHAEAEGWSLEDGLTEEGQGAAERLSDVLDSLEVDAIFSSPARRARETVASFASRSGLPVTTLPDLREHRLSLQGHDPEDPMITRRFEGRGLSRPGGESFNEAERRLKQAILIVSRRPVYMPVMVTHGGLLASLLSRMDTTITAQSLRDMPRPALYRLTHERGSPTGVEALPLPG